MIDPNKPNGSDDTGRTKNGKSLKASFRFLFWEQEAFRY